MNERLSRLLWLLAALALGALTALGGCRGQAEDAARPTAQQPVLRVWFPDASGERIVSETREGTGSGRPLAEALAALVAGPRSSALAPALPAGTTVDGAEVSGTTARVDLGSAFAEGYPPGGSAAEIIALAPIVFTATEVSGVERVILTVAGRAPDLAGSSFDLSAPLRRSDFPPEIAEARR